MPRRTSEQHNADPTWSGQHGPQGRHPTVVWAIGGLLLFVACPAPAARWSVTPLILLSETYTNNVTLAPKGLEEEEYVTEVTPGVQIRSDGPTLKLNAGLQLQQLFFKKDPDRNSSHTILFADGVKELSPNTLFLDFSAQRSPQIVSLDRPLAIDSISDTGNLTDVSQYSIGPRFERRFGSYGQLSADYRYGAVNYDDSAIADSVVQEGAFSASGGEDPSYNWRWDTKFNTTRIDRVRQEPEERESGSLELDRRLSPKLLGLVRGGYANDTLPGVTDFNNGSYWAAGLEWLPTGRIDVRLLYGDLYKEARLRVRSRSGRTDMDLLWQDIEVGAQASTNGNIYGTVRHRGGRMTWVAQYTKESTNESLTRVVQTQNPGQVDPVTGEPLTPVQNILSLTNQNFVMTRWETSALYHGAKSDFGFGLYEEQRNFLITAEGREKTTGGDASWTWRFKPFTSLLLKTSGERNQLKGGRTDDLRLYYLGLLHDLSHAMTISLIYRRADLTSTDASAEFGEDRLTLRFEKQFR